MSIRTSIILVVALAMVAGYVFFIQLRQVEEEEEEPPWFYNLDIADLTRIHIEDSAGNASFHLGEDNNWRIGDPEGIPVGLDRWGGITLLLTGPRSRRLLDEQPTDPNLADYGLDAPPTVVEVDLKDGRSINVLLGFATPDGSNNYAQVEGFPQVFTVFSGWRESLTKLIDDPPYPQWYYNASAASINRFELFTDEGFLSLIKENDEWRFNNEEAALVDPEVLPGILEHLEKPDQELVLFDTLDLTPYGLDEPVLSLFMETQKLDDEGFNVLSHTRYLVGGLTEDGSAYYAQTVRGEFPFPEVFTIEASWVEAMQSLAADYPHTDGTQNAGP
ncbi:MAG: DUF4340 domain-containing protein [Chloroflexota bacterium]|nr:DUF4340 domain-containing protein [Chloroflexota bacterium]MDE2940844.1 DUF4340 domain-containing protein [Chloroflexota bacterium]MDE3267566.1 DUF4340 domain-containing protein [Chloroflexota bacterium]